MKKRFFPTPVALTHFLLWGFTFAVVYILCAGISPSFFAWAGGGLVLFHVFLTYRAARFLKRSIFGALGLCAVLMIGAFFMATTPLTAPTHTLTNGRSTVVFQEMYHIAAPQFYTDVRRLALVHANAGAHLFEEGVSGTREDFEKLEAQVMIDNGARQALAEAAGLTLQNKDLLKDLPSTIADTTAGELVALMAPYAGQKREKMPDKDETSEAIDALKTNTNWWRDQGLEDFNRSVMQGIFRYSVRFQAFVPKDPMLTAVILDHRDNLLANAVLASKNPQVLVVYGGGHFPGFFKKLHAADPNWHEISQETLVAF